MEEDVRFDDAGRTESWKRYKTGEEEENKEKREEGTRRKKCSEETDKREET